MLSTDYCSIHNDTKQYLQHIAEHGDLNSEEVAMLCYVKKVGCHADLISEVYSHGFQYRAQILLIIVRPRIS